MSTDPFSVQLPHDTKPLHRDKRNFFGASGRGYEIDDQSDPTTSRTPYLGVSLKPTAFFAFSLFLGILFVVFTARSVSLQIFQGEIYHALAESNRIRLEKISAPRGIIFDRTGVALVENAPYLILALRPIDFPRDEKTKTQVIDRLRESNIDYAPVLDLAIKNKYRADWIPIAENLTHEEAVTLAVRFKDIPSLAVRASTRRAYHNENTISLSHILGYLGKVDENDVRFSEGDRYDPADYIGKTGLEAFYESTLRGTPGKKQIEVDALGREKEVIAREEPHVGADLVLGLDKELQEKTEAVLAAYLAATGKKRGAVVIIDPRNGEIRSLVSLPAFDNNHFSVGITHEEYQALRNDPDHPLFGRALSGTYPSGSTIKPVIASAALQEGVISTQTTILSVGGISVGQWFFPDWKAGGHGHTDVFRAIAESVNTFFYYVGGGYGNFEGLGPERIAVWANRFGLGAPTGIDLPAEEAGFIPTPTWKRAARGEAWYIGDTYHMAIGQGDVLVTPLQMAVVAATIAHDGVRITPHLVIKEKEGNAQQIIDLETARIIQNAMRRTVIEGSARRLADLPITVAGKTGTAEWHSRKSPHAWFIGFAPFENPRFAFAVIVEEGGEGSSIAVPIAKDIMAWVATHLDKFD